METRWHVADGKYDCKMFKVLRNVFNGTCLSRVHFSIRAIIAFLSYNVIIINCCISILWKIFFCLIDDNNYICLFIHYVQMLISCELENLNLELLLTKLPLSAKVHLLTITYKKEEWIHSTLAIAFLDQYNWRVMLIV